MKRRTPFIVCLAASLILLGVGWIVPAHLRAVDLRVIRAAGVSTYSLADRANLLLKNNELGSARLFAAAARSVNASGRADVENAVNKLAQSHPAWEPLGGPEPRLESLLLTRADSEASNSVPFTDFLLRDTNSVNAMEALAASGNRAVSDLYRCRSLTNTAIFSPSQSSAGQAFDAAIGVTGLLLLEGRLTPALSNAVDSLAVKAGEGGDTTPCEELLLAFLSLGQRFDWNQLSTFCARIDDPQTVLSLAGLLRQFPDQEAVVFAAVVLSGQPSAVSAYLSNHEQTGLADITTGLRANAGGLHELLKRNLPLSDSRVRRWLEQHDPLAGIQGVAAEYSWKMTGFALTLKWLMYLAAGFLLAFSLHFARREPSELERPLQVRGIHVARELLFALGFLLVVLVLSEPFLAEDTQKGTVPFRISLPMSGQALVAATGNSNQPFVTMANFLTMLLFFVLQALLYIACLVKLAEIRRQRVPSRLKLRLLENEEHLFDAGLYLGFLGTIVAFILSSMAVGLKFNLMVAYSSTSFGILFVSFFKIFHLRPLRRVLVLEAETESTELPASAGGRVMAPTV